MFMRSSKAAVMIVLTCINMVGCISHELVEELSLAKACDNKYRVGAVNLISGRTVTFNRDGGTVRFVPVKNTLDSVSTSPVVIYDTESQASYEVFQDTSELSPYPTDSTVFSFERNFLYEVIGVDTEKDTQNIPGVNVRSLMILRPAGNSYGPYILVGVFVVLFSVSPTFREWLGKVVSDAIKGDK